MSEHPENTPSEPPFVMCLHCGRHCEAKTRVCPQCGNVHFSADGRHLALQGTLPAPLSPEERQRANNSVNLGAGLGCIASLAMFTGVVALAGQLLALHLGGSITHVISKTGFFVPIVVVGFSYLLLRTKYPLVARGLGYVVIIVGLFTLGASLICGPPTL